MSRAELAMRWGMSKGTLANWAMKGKGPATHNPGRGGSGARYLVSDVEAWESESANVETLDNGNRGTRLSAGPVLGYLDVYRINSDYLPNRLAEAIKTARYEGFVTLAMGDELACKVLRMHPFEVWGQEYEDKVWFDMDEPDIASVAALPVPEVIALPFAA